MLVATAVGWIWFMSLALSPEDAGVGSRTGWIVAYVVAIIAGGLVGGLLGYAATRSARDRVSA